jgi:hypothetical protein
MPGPPIQASPGPFDYLQTWVSNLHALQKLCVQHGFGKEVGMLTPNAFAQAKVKATVGNVYNFTHTVAAELGGFDPNDPAYTPGDKTDFTEVSDWVSPHSLLVSADSSIRSAASNQGKPVPGDTLVTALFTDAQWKAFADGVAATGLGDILSSADDLARKLAKFDAHGSAETYRTLLDCLTAVQPVPDGR